MLTIIKYKKITIDHSICIKVFSDGTVSYLTVSTDDVINTTTNETEFPDLRTVFEEYFGIKLQEGYVLKYLNFLMFQSPPGFSVDHTDHIMELVNEWLPNGKFRKVDTTFRTDSKYEKDLMIVLRLTVNDLCKEEMEYNGKFGHTLRWIQHIYLMSIIGFCYIA